LLIAFTSYSAVTSCSALHLQEKRYNVLSPSLLVRDSVQTTPVAFDPTQSAIVSPTVKTTVMKKETSVV